MPKYELTIVLDSLQKSEEMENIISKTQSFIKNNGGEIHHLDDWGKKRLAYEVNRKQYGNYYQIFFEGPSSLPVLLEKELKLEDSLLRYMILKSEYDPSDFEKTEEQDSEAAEQETKSEAEQETKSEKAAETESDTSDTESETKEEPEKATEKTSQE